MNTRLIATLSALSIGAFANVSAKAEDATADLAWQQPGYVMEVVVATAPRPKALEPETQSETGDAVLAWQQPGYVQEVVIATAKRIEAPAIRFSGQSRTWQRPAWRQAFLGALRSHRYAD